MSWDLEDLGSSSFTPLKCVYFKRENTKVPYVFRILSKLRILSASIFLGAGHRPGIYDFGGYLPKYVSTGTHRFPSMCLVAWCSWSWGASTPASRQMCDLACQVTFGKVLSWDLESAPPCTCKSEKNPFMFWCLEFIWTFFSHDTKPQLYNWHPGLPTQKAPYFSWKHRYLRSRHI